MAGTNVANVQAAFHRVYDTKLREYLPIFAEFCKNVPMEPSPLGDTYEVCLRARLSHSGAGGSANDGAFALAPFRGSSLVRGRIEAFTHVWRESMAWGDVKRAMASKSSFISGTKELVKGLMDTSVWYTENFMVNGWSFGKIASAGGGTATTAVLTFVGGEFAPGLWGAAENMLIEARLSSNLATLVSSGEDAKFAVVSVNDADKTVTVSGSSTGITALKAISADHEVGPVGFYGVVAPGLVQQVTNTGTIFNIDSTVYGIARGNTIDAGGTALTRELIEEASARCSNRGNKKDLLVYLAHNAFGKVAANEAAYRRFDSGDSKLVNGAKELEFYSSNGATLKLKPHGALREGQVILVPEDSLRRVGASDFALGTPGADQGSIEALPDNAGVQIKCGSIQSLYTCAMSHSALITNFQV